MADISITAGSVGIANDAKYIKVQFGESVSIGQAVYRGTNGKYYKTDADTELTAAAAGIAISSGGVDDYGLLVTSGKMRIGATVAVGTVYAVSTTLGGICPIADLGSGDYITTLGVATSTSTLQVDIQVSGVAKA